MDEPTPLEEYMQDSDSLTTVEEPTAEIEHPVDLTQWLRRHSQISKIVVDTNGFDPVEALLNMKRIKNFRLLNKISLIIRLMTNMHGTNRQRASINRICTTLESSWSEAGAVAEDICDSNTVFNALQYANSNVSRPFFRSSEEEHTPYMGDMTDED